MNDNSKVLLNQFKPIINKEMPRKTDEKQMSISQCCLIMGVCRLKRMSENETLSARLKKKDDLVLPII